MKVINYVCLLVTTALMIGCSTKCDKINLSQNDKLWVNHFKVGEVAIFKNMKGQYDTLEVSAIQNLYTPCNNIELSNHQFEKYAVFFKYKSKNDYNGSESIISITTESWKKRIPYIYLDNLGPYKNDLRNAPPLSIDTVLAGRKMTSVYFYAKDLNTEQYDQVIRIKNFFWNQKLGLLAYTLVDNDVFVRID